MTRMCDADAPGGVTHTWWTPKRRQNKSTKVGNNHKSNNKSDDNIDDENIGYKQETIIINC